MDTKDTRKCESELIEQGHRRDEARRMCAEREGSEEKNDTGFAEDEEE